MEINSRIGSSFIRLFTELKKLSSFLLTLQAHFCILMSLTDEVMLLTLSNNIGSICTFEKECTHWSFLNSKQLSHNNDTHADNASGQLSLNNFRIVISDDDISSNHYAYYRLSNDVDTDQKFQVNNKTLAMQESQPIIAMLVSQFFDRTDTQCELHFRFYVRADSSASGAGLLVTTEQLSLKRSSIHAKESPTLGNPAMEEEDEDWTRPILRERFEPDISADGVSKTWRNGRVPLGQFNFPTRIRIECHPSSFTISEVKVPVECSIDDLQLVNCAEKEWSSTDDRRACPTELDSCTSFGSVQQKQLCLRNDQICDMHADCADGEDESDELYKCFQVPGGARCDFEDMHWLPSGCPQWRFFSSLSGGRYKSRNDSSVLLLQRSKQHLVSLEDGQAQRLGHPPEFYYYGGRLYRPDHFLFFSSYDRIQDGQHDIMYSFALSPAILTHRNLTDSLRQCTLHFFYCMTGFSPFQVFLQLRDNPQKMAKPLWTPPRDENSREPCSWRRAFIHITTEALPTNGEYSLKLGFAKLPGSMGSIAIDNLSLSPDCFGILIRSNCTFGSIQTISRHINGLIQRPQCICPDGRALEPNSSITCQSEPSFLHKMLGRNFDVIQGLLAACLFVILSILSLVFCFKTICYFRGCKQKLSPSPSADLHELFAIVSSGTDSRPGTNNEDNGKFSDTHYGISGNPIYESLSLNQLKQIPRHSLKIDKIVGHGAFGEVYEGWLLLSGASAQEPTSNEKAVKVAIKSLPVESAHDFGDDFETEARLLNQFKHQNIVNFFGVSFEQQPKLIILEFLEGGDLKNFLRENRPKPQGHTLSSEALDSLALKIGDLIGFSLDIARGCQHLEDTRFVHRDIAARNCLLTSKVGHRIVKIADFGMARDIYRNDYYRKGGKAFLPIRWMPPESFLDGLFTSKTDVWAYGVLLWEIFSLGYIPYPGRDNLEVMRLVVAGDRLDPPIGIPDEIYELMLCCWNTESEQRPKFIDLVCAFETLLKNKDLIAEPLPPIRNRLINDRSLSVTPSTSRADAQPASTISQATISTGVYSSNGGAGACGSTSTYETMPINGDGVCRAVFPPYQSRQSEEKFIRLFEPKQSGENGSVESGSQDESAGTVKLRNVIKPTSGESSVDKVRNGWFRRSRRPSLPDISLPTEQRDHSLPPFPTIRIATKSQYDDQDSGIA